MENKKYQIFVSSTYTDLIEARKKVIESILEMDHFPVGMEMFSADTSDQWTVIKRTIDESDYYVVIIGHRYGSVEPESGISYTEKEYDYAVSKEIPVLAFIQNDNVPLTDQQREFEPNFIEKLNSFKNKAKKKMCQFWSNYDELIAKVPTALHKSFKNYPQIGWVRGNQAISPEMALELARLSKENNELKKQLERIENTDFPDIQVFINEGSEIVLRYPDKFNGLIQEKPTLLNKEKIDKHLLNFISDKEIENFNDKIIELEDSDIEKYNQAIIKEKLVNEYSQGLSISVSNIGNVKATDLHIEIEFPDSVGLFDEFDKPEVKIPQNPIPINPLIEANKKYKDSLFTSSLSSALRIGSSLRDLTPRFTDYSFSEPINFSRLNVNKNIRIFHNNVIISKNSLLHTLSQDFINDVYIYPIRKGEFTIKISIICEQYKTSKEFEIPLIIN
ncbi:DUF4062 domain-containing protein [Actinobacillus vicugnae]|uniref:DUF4062 domain-containing protein n=1 Tax=Actinobacillus vicugnae TaxID=2573093 RepID=UPI0012427C99|nr:DUF4062 domain-containing protein [Actinobacillus vicugnae]